MQTSEESPSSKIQTGRTLNPVMVPQAEEGCGGFPFIVDQFGPFFGITLHSSGYCVFKSYYLMYLRSQIEMCAVYQCKSGSYQPFASLGYK